MRRTYQRQEPSVRRSFARPRLLFASAAATAMLVCAALAPPATAAGEPGAAGAAPAGGTVDVKVVRRGTPHDALYDVAFEGERGIAVGAFGTVLASTDGGATWAPQPFPMKHLALMSVAMRDGKCIAVGQTGLVYAAEDCKSWKAAPSMTKSRLLAVGVNRQGVAYAVGAFGTILKSTDWGKSWTVQKVDWSGITEDGAEPHLYDVHVADDGVVTAVGEFELVLRSGGDSSGAWKALHKGARSLFGLSVREDGRFYAVGQSGALLASTDGGASWRSGDTGTGAILTGVHVVSNGDVLASGINALLISRDGGVSWKTVSSKLLRNAWHQAMAVGDAGGGKRRLVAVGAGGSILELEL